MKQWFALVALSMCFSLSAQTIEEKRSVAAHAQPPIERKVSSHLRKINTKLASLQQELHALYAQVPEVYAEENNEGDLEFLVEQIGALRTEIADLQREWHEHAKETSRSGGYALWHHPWTSIEQLVMDYGADDHVYLIPPEVGIQRLSVASNLPVPRECWGELLEEVLAQNGIGIQQINPLLRQLYSIQDGASTLAAITAERTDLALFRSSDRIGFVLSPPMMQLRPIFHFLIEFCEESPATITRIGNRLLLVGTVHHIQEMLKLYDFSEVGSDEHQYQMVTLNKMAASEMKQIVELYFDREVDPPYGTLQLHAPEEPGNALFLSGTAELVRQAKQLIETVETQISDPRETVVYTYTVHHSDAEELASVLSNVYELMRSGAVLSADAEQSGSKEEKSGRSNNLLAIDPAPITARSTTSSALAPAAKGNFVVSPKTGALIMVVEQEMLPKLKSLLRKLDVPKRMVKIDVLLFEKRVTDHSRFGLDLLRIGSAANRTNQTGFQYGGAEQEMGIIKFLVSRVKERWVPAFDFIYDFLMSREDIRINASPSVTTVNNTEAKIDLVEEISIDTGIVGNSNGNSKNLKRSFARTQYGIRIHITPSINVADTRWGDGRDTITLDTNVLFDTPRPSNDGRPPVIRRQIANQVRIPNGQTVVLGGLRSRMSEETESGLPLLSEIPYFGKIFGSTKGCDRDTEMFIFITPTIIEDTGVEMLRAQREMLTRRPGDLPEFLQAVAYARDQKQKVVFERTLETMFGPWGP